MSNEETLNDEFWTTCSSYLSRELHNRDVPWDNRLCWIASELLYDTLAEWNPDMELGSYTPAYSEDLLERIIPKTILIEGVDYEVRIQKNHAWHISYVYEGSTYENYVASSIWKSEALAEMIIYLLKNRIINPEDIQ